MESGKVDYCIQLSVPNGYLKACFAEGRKPNYLIKSEKPLPLEINATERSCQLINREMGQACTNTVASCGSTR